MDSHQSEILEFCAAPGLFAKEVIMDFIENVISCGKYMQAKLPLKSKTLQALSSIDPVVRGHSQAVIQLKELAIIMKHLVPTESDPSMEILRYNVVGPCHKSGKVSSPHAGHQRSRRRTGITMFKREDVKLGPVDKTVCRNIRAAGKKDKSFREKRIEERKKRQAEYGCRASCGSAERAKTTAQAEERQARLRRGKAEECS
ncbi:putative thioester dehydrase [Labeo rohita]|uniref:Thioester dehydrase n=1 Tax=Labeo rohita TaxID=84645 RepID=A0ABQ8LDD8_LABRO|nr:putative thioester dehydrase [Labeo rohita]